MNIPLFFTILAFSGALYLWLGKRAGQNVKTDDDYFLMGRNLGYLPLTFTLLATQLGGGVLLGAAEEAYKSGWIVVLYPLGVSLGLIVLGMGFGAKLRKMNISTIAEIFEKIYDSKSLRSFASILSILTLFFILCAQAIAASSFFASIGWGRPEIFLIFWMILVTYTVMGGFKAVVDTDVVQAVFILVALGIAFFSFGEIEQSYTIVTPKLATIPWSGWLLMPLLFMLIEQDMGQRCFAAKTPRTVSLAAVSSGVLIMLAALVAIYFGVTAKAAGIPITEGSSVLVEAITAFTNPTVATLFMVAIFMAVISTADSLLCSISSNICCDFLPEGINRARVLTLFTGLTAAGVGLFYNDVVKMLIFSYELSVSILFVPIVAAILSKNPSKRGALASMLLGACGFIIFRIYETPIPKEVATLLLSTLGYIAVPSKNEAMAVTKAM